MIRSFVKFIRLPNLIIVGITQYALLYFLLLPFLEKEGLRPVLDHLHFFLFVFDTVLITLTGNIINDIEDYEIDLINRPEEVFVSQYISVSKAHVLYWIVVLIGFSLALYLAFHIDKLPLVGIYPFAVGLLYCYSRFFKKMPFIGNLVVGVFCAGVAGIVLFAEREAYGLLGDEYGGQAFFAFFIYGLFAFLTTIFRELVKDLEDMEGDKERGCQTLPLVIGAKNTRNFALIFALATIGLTIYLSFVFSTYKFHILLSIYPALTVTLPMIYLSYKNINARTKKDYHHISSMMKIIMLAGLLFLPLFYFLQ